MSNAIYDQHDKAFQNVSAYVVMKGAERVASVAFKFGPSGLRTTAFVHWLGVPMVKGVANGGGYDKATASVADAARKIPMLDVDPASAPADQEAARRMCLRETFAKAASLDGGKRWDDAVRDAGFQVYQAV